MKVRHLISLLLKLSGGTIDSKTKLQKEIYFISLLLKKDYGFIAHYYGPYSFEVERGLDELIGAGFINIKRDVLGIDSKRGFEIKRYNISLTDSGERLSNIILQINKEEEEEIQKFKNKMNEIGNPDYLSLSIAAKVCYIISKETSLTTTQVIEKANKINWKIDETDINTAVNILEKLKFIKKD